MMMMMMMLLMMMIEIKDNDNDAKCADGRTLDNKTIVQQDAGVMRDCGLPSRYLRIHKISRPSCTVWCSK